jgi:hypothetical protein
MSLTYVKSVDYSWRVIVLRVMAGTGPDIWLTESQRIHPTAKLHTPFAKAITVQVVKAFAPKATFGSGADGLWVSHSRPKINGVSVATLVCPPRGFPLFSKPTRCGTRDTGLPAACPDRYGLLNLVSELNTMRPTGTLNIHRFLLSLLLTATATEAQWLNYPAPGTPRTRDGKVNLTAPAPHTRDGKPDISGVWHPAITSEEEWRRSRGDAYVDERLNTTGVGMGIGTVSIYSNNVFLDLKPGDNPMRPETKLKPRPATANPCLPFGFPLAILLTPVHKVVQAPGMTFMMLEEGNFTRQIYTDGRPLPLDPQPSWFGYSIGKWQQDTFVTDTVGFNDLTPLDGVGHPRSETMHTIERYRRRDFGHMDVEITFDDRTLYTHPFSIHFVDLLEPDSDILENFCEENEKDVQHMNTGTRAGR